MVDTITIKLPKMKSPKAGDVLVAGQSFEIRWEPIEGVSTDHIEIFWSPNASADWDTVSVDTPDDSSYVWSVPPTYTEDAYMLIAAVDGAGEVVGFDTNDEPFRIANPTDIEGLFPSRFAFRPAQPNPFAGSTALFFDLPRASHVQMKVYSVRGRLVRVLADKKYPPGRHLLRWDGLNQRGVRVGSGVYLVRFDSETWKHTRKITVLR